MQSTGCESYVFRRRKHTLIDGVYQDVESGSPSGSLVPPWTNARGRSWGDLDLLALHVIFDTALAPAGLLDPSLAPGPNSLWCRDLRLRELDIGLIALVRRCHPIPLPRHRPSSL